MRGDERRVYMELLLMGDEQADMVERYLERGEMFVGYVSGQAVAVCVTVDNRVALADDVCGIHDPVADSIEVKNLAVAPGFRRQGLGRQMLGFVERRWSGRSICLGTGETPSTLRFYASCGYAYSHRVPGFFPDNYDHPIVEEGVLLTDMLYLVKAAETDK